MSGTNAGIIEVDFRAEIAHFDLQVRKTREQFEKMANGVKRDSEKVEAALVKMHAESKEMASGMAMMQRAGQAMFAVFASGAMMQRVKQSLDFADEIVNTADSIGVLTEEYQEMQFLAEQAGIAQQEFNSGIEKFAKNIGAASMGGKQAKEMFGRLGIQVRDSNGTLRSTSDILEEASESFLRVSSETEKARLATDLFGKSGIRFSLLLAQGSEELRRQAEEAKRLGIVLDDSLLRQAEEAGDAVNELHRSFQSFTNEMILTFAPQIKSGANALTELIQDLREAKKELEGYSLSKAASETLGFAGKVGYTAYAIPGALASSYLNISEFLMNDPINPDKQLWESLIKISEGLTDDLRKTWGLKPSDPVMKLPPVELQHTYPTGSDLDLSREVDEFDKSIRKTAADYDRLLKPVLRGLEKERIDSLTKYEDLLGPVIRKLEQQHDEWESIADGINSAYDETYQLKKSEEEYNLLLKERLISTQVYQRAMEAAKERQIELENQLLMASETFGAGATVAMRDYFTEIGNEAQNAYNLVSDTFRGMEDVFVQTFTTGRLELEQFMAAIQADLGRILYRKTIGSMLESALGAFAGARADGGPVSAGRPYLIGERGPELFVPERSGYVAPNAAIGEGKSVHLEQHNYWGGMPGAGRGRPSEMVYSPNQILRRTLQALGSV